MIRLSGAKVNITVTDGVGSFVIPDVVASIESHTRRIDTETGQEVPPGVYEGDWITQSRTIITTEWKEVD